MNQIKTCLQKYAECCPEKNVIQTTTGNELSYADLLEQTHRFTNVLRNMSHGVVSRVAIVIVDNFLLAQSVIAVIGNYIAAPINPQLTMEEFQRYFYDLKIDLLVTCGDVACQGAIAAAKFLKIPILLTDQLINQINGNLSHYLPEKNQPTGLLLCTSGTTSNPKKVFLSEDKIEISALNIASTLELFPNDVCFNLMPLFHIHGLIAGLFASIYSGGSVLLFNRFNMADFLTDFSCYEPTWITGTPSIYSSIVHRAKYCNYSNSNKKLRFIRSSSAPLYETLHDDLEHIFSVPVVQAYGMTEACHQIISQTVKKRSSCTSVGFPTITEVQILGHDKQFLSANIEGEIVIKGSTIISAYENDEMANQLCFYNDWFCTGDLGYLTEEGELFITGRIKEIINKSGEKISPYEVENIIGKLPAVNEVACFPIKDEHVGEKIGVAIVLNQGYKTRADAIQNHVSLFLAHYKVPDSIFFVDALPKSGNGKLQRNFLADLFVIQTNSRLDSGVVQSSGEILIPLLEMVNEVFKLSNITPNVSFFELGGNSLLGIQLIARINEYFDTALNVSELYEHPILSELANLIVQFKSSPESLRLPVLATLSVRPNRFELSSAQARIWLTNHLPEAQGLYQMILSYRLKGPLSVDALQKSIALLVQRQEQLRFTIQVVDGKPYQSLSREQIELNIVRLDYTLHQSIEHQLQETIDAIVKAGFNVDGGDVLFQPYLIQIANQDNVLLFHMHHMVSDGWSNQILQKELSFYYNAYCQNDEIDTSPLPISYIDYVNWLREWQTETWLKQEVSSWKDYLGNAPSLLALPTDYPRPKEMCYEGAVEYFELSETITHALNQFSAHHQMSLYMVMLTVFKVLLTHYTGEQKIVVGTVAANRQVSQLEGIIGFFANTLVMATDLPGSTCWQDAFESVKKSTLYVFQHAEFPFEALVKELNPERQLNYHPIFQVVFNFFNVSRHDLNLAELSSTEIVITDLQEPLDLNVSLYPSKDGIKGRFSYNKMLFRSETIQRWIEHYKKLLHLAMNNLTSPIGTTDFLLEDERDLLLNQWIATEIDYPRDETVIGKFEKVVAESPNDIALIYGNQEMTYAELDAKASVVGKMLVQSGVRRGDLVAICLERSCTMVIGLLGIWKAGAGYVPLVKQDPASRLIHILQETQCKIILTDSKSIETVAAKLLSGKIIQIDDECSLFETERVLLPQIQPEDIAYVLYTSGSTGKPKGVVVEHRGLWSFLWGYHQQTKLQKYHRILQLASYSFDMFLFDLYLPLIVSNVTVVLPEAERSYDPLYLSNLIVEKKINYLCGVPSFLRVLTDVLKTKQHLPLRAIYSAGEALLPSDVQRFHGDTGADIYNLYGPTESIGGVSQGYCSPTEALVTLGRPAPNTRLYVLNAQLQLVPSGCYGELYISTAYLAKGYLNNALLTADNFIPNPFLTPEDQATGRYLRLYKSGDMVCWLPDGRLQFAGRIDSQIKIRGHRVESGEVEAGIATHPAIQSVAVIKHLEQLIAFVVLNQVTDIKLLRQAALEKLPSFMLPAHWVILSALPYTATGKIDREALSQRVSNEQFANEDTNELTEPKTSLETWLATQWSNLLNVDQVGLEDHFFMLGGDSLLAIKLISKINQHFKISLEVSQFFESPQLKQLANEIKCHQGNKDSLPTHLPILTPLTKRPEKIALSSSQMSIWFVNQLPGAQALYQTFSCHRLKGPLSLEALQKSIQLLVERHEQLRMNIHIVDGVPYQTFPQHDIKLKIIQLDSNANQATLQQIIDTIIQAGLNGPLFQPYVLQITPEDNVLILYLHHLITDGWSKQLLQQELSFFYNACHQQQPAHIPPLPINYVDYIYWLREWQTEEWLQQEAVFWKEYLNNVAPLLVLPYDYPRPKEMSYEGATEYFELSNDLVLELNQFASQHHMSLYMVMLAVFKVLLSHYTGEQKIVLGTVLSNRLDENLEQIIGFFANTLVVSTDLSSTLLWSDAFNAVKNSSLQAFQHAQFPFETLVKEINPERQLNYHPIFQIMFNLINVPQHALTFSGLMSTDQSNDYIKEEPFDLAVSLYPTNQGLKGQFRYNKKLFKPETIKRWAEHYKNLLCIAISNLTNSIHSTDFLLTDEKDLILNQWTSTGVEYPRNETAIGKFEKIANQNPHDIALIYANLQMTYAELDAKSSVVGKMLVQKGVRPGNLVAICIERSFTMVIGLLGIWKSGAGYVPINRKDPVNRVTHILQETGCNFILVDAKSIEDVAAMRRAGEIIQIDDASTLLRAVETQLPRVKPEDIAYVLYTSGSTGMPKGVMVEHRSVWDYLWAGSRAAHLQPHSRFLQLAPYTFDEILFDLYIPLISNVAVVLPEPNQHHDIQSLTSVICEKKVNYINSVPSFLRLLGQALKSCPELRTIYAIGEELLWSDVQLLHDNTGATICNRYGQTETVGIVSQGFCDPSEPLVTLGRPIANTRLYVLNSQLQPVPIGCYGELYVAKAHLAKGYIGKDVLTAGNFIPNPFASVDDYQNKTYLCLYKSGDKVRWLPDGRLQFAGRMDFQVKIRGHRVEPGEVEAVIATYPTVQNIAVVKHSEQLIAFVVLNRLTEVNTLRLYALENLPSFMLPAHWVVLTALPETKTGKIDRTALLSLVNQRQFINENANLFIKPQTSVEQWLATQWATLLNVDPIGVMDHFFMLGGNSLLAMELTSKINRYFDITFEVYQLFESPQLKQLAQKITLLLNKKSVLPRSIKRLFKNIRFKLPEIELNLRSNNRNNHDDTMPKIRAKLSAFTSDWHGEKHNSDSLIVGHNVKGDNHPLFWCLQSEHELHQLAHYMGPDQPTYGMRSLHMTNISYTSENIALIAEYYANEIINIKPNGHYIIGGNCQASHIALQIAKNLIAKGKQVPLLILLEHSQPSFYSQKIMLLYGRESGMNPYQLYENPDAALKLEDIYPAGYTLNLINGAHGQFFDEPNIIDFTDRLKEGINHVSNFIQSEKVE